MPSEMSTRDQQQWSTVVETLKSLRRSVVAAESHLFREAHKIETTRDRLWKQIYATFDECLKDLHICDPTRYRNFLAAENALGARQIDAIGVPSAIQATKIHNPEDQQKFIQAAAKRNTDDGVPWSDQQAATMRKTISPPPPKLSNWNKKVDRETALHAENVELKRQVQNLKREIKEKDAEIARLQRTIRKVA
jgi:hypothetical protein